MKQINGEKMDILHCDINNFFASSIVLKYPELKGKPVAVGGNEQDRHGVIVSANYEAKKFGIKCGVTTYQAKKMCKDIVIKESDFALFNELSLKIRKIYEQYTDKIEVFSIDECFLDVTGSHKLFGTSEQIAYKIKEQVKKEVGLTISVGVSFCKSLAKLGSDLKKPDAVTIVSKENYKQIIENLPVGSLIGIGRRTNDKLLKLNIKTLGELSRTDKKLLETTLGVIGTNIYNSVNGLDNEPVITSDPNSKPKSIGNSTTFYKDLTDHEEIKLGLSIISENIIERCYAKKLFYAKTLSIVVRDSNLDYFQKQTPIRHILTSKNITDAAYQLFMKYFEHTVVRLIGITISNFCESESQLSFFDDDKDLKKQAKMDKAVLDINHKYGDSVVFKANRFKNEKIASSFDKRKDKND